MPPSPPTSPAPRPPRLPPRLLMHAPSTPHSPPYLPLAPVRLVRVCHRTSCDKQANTYKQVARGARRAQAHTHTRRARAHWETSNDASIRHSLPLTFMWAELNEQRGSPPTKGPFVLRHAQPCVHLCWSRHTLRRNETAASLAKYRHDPCQTEEDL